MKNLYLLITSSLLLLGLTLDTLAQSKNEWYAGARVLTVSHGVFQEGNDFGGGFYIGYSKKISSKRRLKWLNEVGFDALLPCNRPEGCRSWWYEKSIRYYSGLEKDFISGSNIFTVGMGINFFYGSQQTTLWIAEYSDFVNDIYTKSITKIHEPVFSYFQPGLRAGYRNKNFSEQLTFTFGYDWVWNNHLSTFSTSYRLKK